MLHFIQNKPNGARFANQSAMCKETVSKLKQYTINSYLYAVNTRGKCLQLMIGNLRCNIALSLAKIMLDKGLH